LTSGHLVLKGGAHTPWRFGEDVMTLDPPFRPALIEDAPILAE
jgi:hypothetical protein